MKTTLDLPDDLLIEAKATAARRRMTLRELVTRALERDLRPVPPPTAEEHFTIDEDGWPVFERKGYTGPPVTNELVNRLREQEGI
ncbi:hypothetical protein [Haloferula sp. A504]|uniref:hypothetical protein n=1 Tax=Haloferula sp. A504 TaxID=3373601 RepID=UPI0031C3A8F6|nr:hypothetical protein [Verrucomicrobiaceae bacterium E54]